MASSYSTNVTRPRICVPSARVSPRRRAKRYWSYKINCQERELSTHRPQALRSPKIWLIWCVWDSGDRVLHFRHLMTSLWRWRNGKLILCFCLECNVFLWRHKIWLVNMALYILLICGTAKNQFPVSRPPLLLSFSSKSERSIILYLQRRWRYGNRGYGHEIAWHVYSASAKLSRRDIQNWGGGAVQRVSQGLRSVCGAGKRARCFQLR